MNCDQWCAEFTSDTLMKGTSEVQDKAALSLQRAEY